MRYLVADFAQEIKQLFRRIGTFVYLYFLENVYSALNIGDHLLSNICYFPFCLNYHNIFIENFQYFKLYVRIVQVLVFLQKTIKESMDRGEYSGGQEQNYEDQYFYEQEEYVYGDEYSGNQDNPYDVIPLSNIFHNIKSLVDQIETTVAMPFGWSLLILREFKWQVDRIGEYFTQMDKYKQLICYSPTLLTTEAAAKDTTVDYCGICLEKKPLIKNICKDSFCRDCWSGHISENLNNLNPFMKCMGCQVPLLYQTVKYILNDPLHPGYSKVFNRYQKQICEFFTTTSRNYQCCPGVECNYCIKCDSFSVTTVQCKCGKSFCFKCKNDDHSPCTCQERAKWIDVVLKQQADAKWIAQNTKLCPWCNKAVERSAGCNFMACLCGKSFCYMCSKPWQPDHKDHFKCHIYRKKDNDEQNRQKAVLQKINFYAERYLGASGMVKSLKAFDTFEKRRFLYEKLSIQLTDSDFIDQAYKFAIQCCQSLKWIYVYSYFVQFLDQSKKQRFQFSQGQYQSFKENLLKKLSFDLKNFLLGLEKYLEANHGTYQPGMKKKYTDEFWSLKTNIINYYRFTKQFKQKFVEQIQTIQSNLIKRHGQQYGEEVKEAKDSKKKGKKK